MSNPAAIATGRRTYLGVQYLRAIAALLVVYDHFTDEIPHWKAGFASVLTPQVGQAGVDIFFVVSGFVMWMTGRENSPGEFFLRRVVRVVPLYWLATLMVPVTVLMPYDLLGTRHFTLLHLVESLTFIPFHNSDYAQALVALLGPGWTLNLEMTFYVLFALALFLPARARLYTVGAVLSGLALTGPALPHLPPIAAFYTSMLMVEFLFGMLIAQLSLTSVTARLSAPVGVVLVIGGVVGLWALDSYTVIYPAGFSSAVAAAMIVLGMVSVEENGGIRRIGLLEAMGDASYSIYLTHLFTLSIVRTVWFKWTKGLLPPGGAPRVVFLIASLASSVLVGILIYRMVELPLLRACRAVLDRRRRASSETAAVRFTS